MKRFIHSVLPAFLFAVSVGQIYAFTNFADEMARYVGRTQQQDVQFAFSLGIFFLGIGAAFFGKLVERNIRISSIVGTILFLGGLCVTALGIEQRSLLLIYLGYGFLLGTGTGIIYICPVKTMMMWFPQSKALAAALPIISFGLGSTLSTIVYRGFSFGDSWSLMSIRYLGLYDYMHIATNPRGIVNVFYALAAFYAVPMIFASLILKKPVSENADLDKGVSLFDFKYSKLLVDPFFIRSWLFMFLNISAGLCLIPLAKQMMNSYVVNYADDVITVIIAFSGLMNGGGRFLFAWWSDHLEHRVDIMLIILAISAGAMMISFWPVMIGLALLIINACYGAGFSVIPAILSDNYGMNNISKIHGAVLSAWGFAGLAGNQAALFISSKFGGYGAEGHGYVAVVGLLVITYILNFFNALSLKKKLLKRAAA